MNPLSLLSTLTLLAALAAPVLAVAQTEAEAKPVQVPAEKPAEDPNYGTLLTPGDKLAKSRTEVSSVESSQVGVDGSVLGDKVTMTLPLLDEQGHTVTLSGLSGGRPVVLQLGYYRCPVICSQVLGNLARWANQTDDLRAGRDYEVVSLSIDPKETMEQAQAARGRTLRGLKAADAAKGWHFLTAPAASIQTITGACGFRYRHVVANNQFAHPGVLVFLSPEGRVTRQLAVNGGIADSAAVVESWRQALADAKAGQVTSLSQPTLFSQCSTLIKNGIPRTASGIMSAGGALMVLLLIPGFFWLRRAEARRKASQTDS